MISQSTIDPMAAIEKQRALDYEAGKIPAYIRVAAKSLLCELADHFDATRSRHAPFWSGEDTALLVAKAIMSAAPSQEEMLGSSGSYIP